jgi:hypothetical protein
MLLMLSSQRPCVQKKLGKKKTEVQMRNKWNT